MHTHCLLWIHCTIVFLPGYVYENQLEKSDARNNTFKQLEILKVANENVKQKRNELAPMRTANLQKRTARSALLESKRQLEAWPLISFFSND